MADIINLNKVRKNKKSAANEKQAAENRVKYGRTGSEKVKDADASTRDRRLVDAHKKDDPEAE